MWPIIRYSCNTNIIVQFNVTVLQCYNVTMFNVTMLQCFSVTLLQPISVVVREAWPEPPPQPDNTLTPPATHQPQPTTHPLGVYSIATAVLPTSTPHSCYDQDIISELYSAPHHPPPPHNLTTHCHHHQGRRVYSTTTTQPHHPPPPLSPHQHHLPPHPTHAR